MNKKIASLVVIVLFFMVGCGCRVDVDTAPSGAEGYKKYVLAPLPDWTNKYAQYDKGDKSYFKLSQLVKQQNLTRLQALELQNHFRDLTEAGMASQAAFDKALAKVKALEFESRLDPKALEQAPFIVAIDVDETLLQQYYSLWKKGPEYYDYLIDFKDGKRGISMAPGWQRLLETIKKQGGLVVIYSANVDDTIWEIADTVTINGEKLSQFADGIMTNNYLIMQGKYEWTDGKKAADPVVNPSKDLRPLDENLDKVIIIDDNPKRIIQNSRLRLTKKYQADQFYSHEDHAAHIAYKKQLRQVAKEIEESYQYSLKNNIPFTQAYLPYTQLGQVSFHWFRITTRMTREEAIEYIRTHPDTVDSKF